jgi:hypothetical protein
VGGISVGDASASSAEVGAATVAGTSVGGIVVEALVAGSGAFEPQAVNSNKIRGIVIREIFMVNTPKVEL